MTNSKKLPEEEEYSAFLKLLSGEEKFELVDFLKVPVEDVPQFENIKTQSYVYESNGANLAP